MLTKAKFFPNIIKCGKMSHDERVQRKGTKETYPDK